MASADSTIHGGYILLARKLLESELMEKPSHYLKLWVWMLAKANWKDRDKLRRGQFVTTIAEMQEAGGYRVGYRVRRLTRDEVRSAYEAFAKASMITTTKTSRGMIITICNYELYQNADNYEAHKVAPDVNAAKPQATPHDTEELKKRRKKTFPVKMPPADSRLFSDWFCYAFEICQGYRYAFEGGKDGKAVAEMLKSWPCKELVAKACHFLTDEKRYPENKAPTLTFLKSKINDYPNHINGKADHLRDIGLLPPDGVLLEDWNPWNEESRLTA